MNFKGGWDGGKGGWDGGWDGGKGGWDSGWDGGKGGFGKGCKGYDSWQPGGKDGWDGGKGGGWDGGKEGGWDGGKGGGGGKGGYVSGYGDLGRAKAASASNAGWANKGAASHTAVPTVISITIGPSSKLALEGYMTEAPAVVFEKSAGVFSYHKDLINQIAPDAVIEHDADWKTYPDIAEFVKLACGEDHCLAIAKSPSQGKWAVGLASGWQGRERAGNVALCLALVAGTDMMAPLASQYPDFGALCSAAGLLANGCSLNTNMAPQVAAPMMGAAFAPIMGELAAPMMGTAFAPMMGAMPGALIQSDPKCPPVHFIEVPPDSQLATRGFPPSAFVISYGGSPFKQFFSSSSNILCELVGDPNLVTLSDDPDWKQFPEVAAAIKSAGGEENCYMLAMCESLGLWAVGQASGKKPREQVAKMAMSLALANAGVPNLAQVAQNHPEFWTLCHASGLALPGGPPAKRPRF